MMNGMILLPNQGRFQHGSEVVNPGFDVTPSRLVTGLITEKGVCPATEDAIRVLFEG